MNETTDDVETLAELLLADTDEPMWSAVVIAKHIIDSDWLAARESAAEARGAERALLEAADTIERPGDLDITPTEPHAFTIWLRDRAALVASSRELGEET